MNVFTVKKEPLKENTFNIYSEMCSKCEKLAEKLSLEREVLYKIWTVFRGDIEKPFNIRKVRRGVHTEIYGVFKFQSGSVKCNWT